MYTKKAMGSLVSRYRSILKKCHLLNTFGSLAVAGMLVMGGASGASGALFNAGIEISTQPSYSIDTTTLSSDGSISTKDDAGTSSLIINEALITSGSVTIGSLNQANDVNVTLEAGSDNKLTIGDGVMGLTLNGNTNSSSYTRFTVDSGVELNVDGEVVFNGDNDDGIFLNINSGATMNVSNNIFSHGSYEDTLNISGTLKSTSANGNLSIDGIRTGLTGDIYAKELDIHGGVFNAETKDFTIDGTSDGTVANTFTELSIYDNRYDGGFRASSIEVLGDENNIGTLFITEASISGQVILNGTDSKGAVLSTSSGGGSEIAHLDVQSGSVLIQENFNVSNFISTENTIVSVQMDDANSLAYLTNLDNEILGQYDLHSGQLKFSHLSLDLENDIVTDISQAQAGKFYVNTSMDNALGADILFIENQNATTNVELLANGLIVGAENNGNLTLGKDLTVDGWSSGEAAIHANNININANTLNLGLSGGVINANLDASKDNSIILVGKSGYLSNSTWEIESDRLNLGANSQLIIASGIFKESSQAGKTFKASDFKTSSDPSNFQGYSQEKGILIGSGNYDYDNTAFYYTENLTLEDAGAQTLDLTYYNNASNTSLGGGLKADVLTVKNTADSTKDNLTVTASSLAVTKELNADTVTFDGIANTAINRGINSKLFLDAGDNNAGTINAELKFISDTTGSNHQVYDNAKLEVLSGDWTANGNITLNSANLNIGYSEGNAKLDLGTNSLFVTGTSSIDIAEDGILSLQLSDLGTYTSNNFTGGNIEGGNVHFNDGDIIFTTDQALDIDLSTSNIYQDIKNYIYANNIDGAGSISIIGADIQVKNADIDNASGIGLAGKEVGIGSGTVTAGNALTAGYITGTPGTPGQAITLETNLSDSTTLKLNGTGDAQTVTLLTPGDIKTSGDNTGGDINETTDITLANGKTGGAITNTDNIMFLSLDNATVSGTIKSESTNMPAAPTQTSNNSVTSAINFGSNSVVEGNIEQSGYAHDPNEAYSRINVNGANNEVKGSVTTEAINLASGSALTIQGDADISDLHTTSNTGQVGTVNFEDNSTLSIGKNLNTQQAVDFNFNGLNVKIDGEYDHKDNTLYLGHNSKLEIGTLKNVYNLHLQSISSLISKEDLTIGNGISLLPDSSLTAEKNLTFGTNNNQISQIFGTLTVKGNMNATHNVYYGDDFSKAVVSVAGAASHHGKAAILDPSWVQNPDGTYYVNAATQVAYNSFVAGIDGNIAVGRNSQFAIGTANTSDLANIISNNSHLIGSAWSPTGISSAVGLFAKQTVATNGSLIVDGRIDELINSYGNPVFAEGANELYKVGPLGAPSAIQVNTGDAYFANQSLLVVANAGTFNNASNFALSGTDGTTGKLTVESGSKLHLAGVVPNQPIYVADFGTANISGWLSSADVTADSLLLANPTISANNSDGTYVVSFEQVATASIFPCFDESTQKMIDEMVATQGVQTNSANAGIEYVSKAISNSHGFGQSNSRAVATIVESAGQMAAITGVAKTAMDTTMARADAILANNTTASIGKTGQEKSTENDASMKKGLNLWLAPQYNYSSFDGQCQTGCTDTDYDTSFTGAAFGADYSFETNFTVGVAANIGAGETETNGNFMKTENDFEYYGFSAYGAYSKNDFTVLADFGYTKTENEIDQDVPSSMLMGNNKAELDAEVLTLGVTAEYVKRTPSVDIIPHVGIRYMHVKTDAYNVTNNDRTVFNVASDSQDVWYFPVGVTFQKDIVTETGLLFRPRLDLGFLAAAGDLDANSNASIAGVNSSMNIGYENVDDIAFNGGIGFELAKSNWSFALNYNLLAGNKQTAHAVFGMINYKY